jgi:hypothetical protein
MEYIWEFNFGEKYEASEKRSKAMDKGRGKTA